MKNTKFRKKALLSSIAMLLVALVALGSATFAWFSANPTASANGLSITTTAAAGLVIDAEYDGNVEFTHAETLNKKTDGGTSTYDATAILQPVSINLPNIGTTDQGTFLTTTASADDDYIAADDTEISGSTSYYTEKIFAKTTGSSRTSTLKLSSIDVVAADTGDEVAAAALASAIRVAVVYHTGETTTLKAVYAPNASSTARYIKSGSTEYGTAAIGNDGVLTSYASSTTLGTVGVDGTDYVQIYVYLDGEDDDCKTTNVTHTLSSILKDIKLNLTVQNI